MTIVKSAVIKAAGSAVLLVAIAGGIARAQDDVERGRLLVTSLCGECHGDTGGQRKPTDHPNQNAYLGTSCPTGHQGLRRRIDCNGDQDATGGRV